jgi:hypothetical protein
MRTMNNNSCSYRLHTNLVLSARDKAADPLLDDDGLTVEGAQLVIELIDVIVLHKHLGLAWNGGLSDMRTLL